MSKWIFQLRGAPEPLSRLERRLVWAATLLVAFTRVAFASRTLWDWDEALFSYALRDYDVAAHHPHPPGFPLFIAAAKLVHAFVDSEFRALQVVALLGAVTLFPLMFLLARELRTPFATAFFSASLLVFFPNVWVYGGTAFSDVPSLALVLLACVLLLRGCRSGGSYVAGAFVLAIAAGFRPQNLLVGLAPALLATWCRIRITRSPVQPLLATLVGALTLSAAFGGAVMATGGWARYRVSVSDHSAYIESVDSFRNPGRPALSKVFDDFFVRPFRMAVINAAIAVLAAISIGGGFLGRRKPIAAALLMFGPFCVLGWLMLDHLSACRFSIAWAPLIALASADGSSIVADLVGSRVRWSRARAIAQIAIPTSLVILMAAWTLPALAITRSTASPPVQAIGWIRRSLPPDARVYVHNTMGPYGDLLLGDFRAETFGGDTPPIWPDDRNAWVLREGTLRDAHARRFSFPRQRLWNIVRRRYFDVSLAPQCTQVRFGGGWYGEEGTDRRSFRWMGARASVLLPPSTGNSAELAFQGYLPLDGMSAPPNVTLTLDGKVVGRFAAADSIVERRFVVASRSDRIQELEFRLDRVVNPKGQGLGSDPRDLGMRLDAISWSGESKDCVRASSD